MRFFPHFLLALAWIVFCLLHSLLAATPVKQKMLRYTGGDPSRFRIVYLLFALASLAAVVAYQLSVTSTFLFRPTQGIRATGFVTGLCGLVIMSVCISRYFLPLSGLQGGLKNNTGNVLLVNGLNRYVRHPLYMGTFMFIWSLWLLYPFVSFLISNSIITLYTLLGARLEEKKLLREFGEQYRTYQKKVPMFIPRLSAY